jgi:hypothetical protein
MSLQLGANFPDRWLTAPQETRKQFLRDLNKVCTLLDPQTDLDEWESDETTSPHQIVASPAANQLASPVVTSIDNETTPQTALPVSTLIALEQRLLKQADQVIERALDPIRAELRTWIQEQIRQEIKAL